jgi:hypothetical protein
MCCGLRSDKARVLYNPHVLKHSALAWAAKVVTGTVRLDSSTNKPTKPLNTLGIFVASNPHFGMFQTLSLINLSCRSIEGTRLSLPCRSRVSALPVLSFAELALWASPLTKIILKVKFGVGGLNKRLIWPRILKNFISYHPLLRIKPGSALRYQQANDPAAAASGRPIAQMRPK